MGTPSLGLQLAIGANLVVTLLALVAAAVAARHGRLGIVLALVAGNLLLSMLVLVWVADEVLSP